MKGKGGLRKSCMTPDVTPLASKHERILVQEEIATQSVKTLIC